MSGLGDQIDIATAGDNNITPALPMATHPSSEDHTGIAGITTGIAGITLPDTIPAEENANEASAMATPPAPGAMATSEPIGPAGPASKINTETKIATGDDVTAGASSYSVSSLGELTPAQSGTDASSDDQQPNSHHGNSRAWHSPEERLRLDFKKFQTDMHHLGCSDSFVLPKNEADFAGLMADLRLARAKQLGKMAKKLEEEKAKQLAKKKAMPNSYSTEAASGSGGRAGPSTAPKAFGPRGPPTDGLSAVLALPSSFNNIWTSPGVPVGEQADWPTAQEYAQGGDNRIRKGEEFRRFLPVPRRNTLDKRLVNEYGQFAPIGGPGASSSAAQPPQSQTQGPEVPWKMREVLGERWDLNRHERHEDKHNSTPAEEIALEDAPPQIQDLIAEIDRQFKLDN